jgi:hypothetical protein
MVAAHYQRLGFAPANDPALRDEGTTLWHCSVRDATPPAHFIEVLHS